jgi:hypothetical protein
MMKKKGCLFMVLFTIATPVLLLFIFFQYRHFYRVGDMDFTFWKTGNGCYIIPYRYWGLTIPKTNYMRASNLAGVVIFIGEESKLYIFPEITYVVGGDTIEMNLSSYKYEYYPVVRGIENVRAFYDMRDYYRNCGYPYININIGEMYAEIRNTIDRSVKK